MLNFEQKASTPDSEYVKQNITTGKVRYQNRRRTFLEKIEKALENSREGTVERRILKGEKVLEIEIKYRLDWLWKQYDRVPQGEYGLIAVWLEQVLANKKWLS
jgi:hypothetical protein